MKNKSNLMAPQQVDRETEASLSQMADQERVLSNRLSGVKLILVVLSSRGMVFDLEALKQKIVLSYPEAAVFFQTTIGKAIGPAAPQKIDLLIDLTGPTERQALFAARKLRKRARVAVGRNSGFFRKRIYNRIYDEKANVTEVPNELLARERFVQKKVLNLAGVAFVQAGETPPDRSKSIALELPPMRRL